MLREELEVVGGVGLRFDEEDAVKEKCQHDEIDHERVESDVGIDHVHHEDL